VTRPSPEEREYARLWLSECWAPVPEWRQTRDERADAETRNALLDDRQEQRWPPS
jgi:hypothetical protein